MIPIQRFGRLPDGSLVESFTLKAPNGLSATLLTYGATLQSFCLPDGSDIVLGFDTLEGYLGAHPYFGAAIGRVANRIEKARFPVGGKIVPVSANENENALHSGPVGFDRVNWVGRTEGNSVVFSHTSPDGFQGYPGNLSVEFRCTLNEAGLRLDMSAKTDTPTPVSLTGHSYFNLGNGNISKHALMSPATHFFETDSQGINHGKTCRVSGSDFDLSRLSLIGSKEMDHHFTVEGKGMRPVAELVCPQGQRRLRVSSDLPGLQIYTGHNIGNIKGKNGRVYKKGAGIAFEPQFPPNAVNLPDVGDVILRPGENWAYSILYQIENLNAA